jgi:hypothetical protein
MVKDIELRRFKSITLFIDSNPVTDASMAPRAGGNFAIRTGNRLIFLATWGIKFKLSQKLEKIRHQRSWVQE